ncbi:TolC family protein [Sulfurimonas crateris]|uniref:TolC family protein n=1 Tax=Sulfurimonas crateris TaxID=2574727 RepID=A0A4U2Z850_9BACT|nr:TolC family protein [Sulfurimonas crateris]TKI69670.1 TolC family protein [Sulfurimonas crateris]
MKNFLFLSFYLFFSLAHARELTLDECIDKALKNHPDIKRLSLSVSKSKSYVDIAKADYLPQINLSAEYNPINTFVMPQNSQFNTIEDDSYKVSAQLNQKIYDFDKTTSTIKAYKKEQNRADFTLEDAKALLIYKVKNYYNLALLQTKALKARQKDLQTKEELYKQSLALVKEGLKTEADASSILSALYIAQDALAVTQADLNKALSSLSLYIGEKIDKNSTLKESTPPKEQNKNLLIKDILAKNFLLKGSKEEIQRDALLYEAAKAANYGSIDAVASYTHQDTLNEYDTSLVGVTLSIPIYSGGRISAESQQAKISKEMAKESYNAQKLLLEEEVSTLLIDLERYRHTIKAKESLIESAMATKKIVEARYKEGLSTYIEVLDAASVHLYAELGLLEAKFSINNTINRLEYLKGEVR